MLDAKELISLEHEFIKHKQNFWNILAHAVSKSPYAPENSIWTINKSYDNSFNSEVQNAPIPLREKLIEVLNKYDIEYFEHIYADENSINDFIDTYENENNPNSWANEQWQYEQDARNEEMKSWGSNWENHNDWESDVNFDDY